MRGVRPSIRGLVAVVTFAAVGAAAIRSNSDSAAIALLVVTVLSLCTATVVASYQRGAWMGFAVFGWAHFLIIPPDFYAGHGPPSLCLGVLYRILLSFQSGPILFDPYDHSFAVGMLPRIETDGNGTPYLIVAFGGSAGYPGSLPLNGLRSGLCLSTLVSGFLGALVGRLVARSPLARQGTTRAVSPGPGDPG